MHAIARTPLLSRRCPDRTKSGRARGGPGTITARLMWTLRQADSGKESVVVDLTGPIASRRFASVGAAVDAGAIALPCVPGHLVAAFEAYSPDNSVDPLDSAAGACLTMTPLEAEGVGEIAVNGRLIRLLEKVTLAPGAVVSLGGVRYVVERDARAHA